MRPPVGVMPALRRGAQAGRCHAESDREPSTHLEIQRDRAPLVRYMLFVRSARSDGLHDGRSWGGLVHHSLLLDHGGQRCFGLELHA